MVLCKIVIGIPSTELNILKLSVRVLFKGVVGIPLAALTTTEVYMPLFQYLASTLKNFKNRSDRCRWISGTRFIVPIISLSRFELNTISLNFS